MTALISPGDLVEVSDGDGVRIRVLVDMVYQGGSRIAGYSDPDTFAWVSSNYPTEDADVLLYGVWPVAKRLMGGAPTLVFDCPLTGDEAEARRVCQESALAFEAMEAAR